MRKAMMLAGVLTVGLCAGALFRGGGPPAAAAGIATCAEKNGDVNGDGAL